MQSLTGLLSRLANRKILVVGDLMLDAYTIGKARRISPEAPVAVVNVHTEEQRPGGAGNVALNLVSLGAQVSIMGRIGSDAFGQLLKATLLDERIDTSGIFEQPLYHTPVKNRIISDQQQIVRVDHEILEALPEVLEQQIIEQIPLLFEGVSLVAVSDYGKGFLTPTLLSALIEYAKKQKIPVIVDPKGIDYSIYRGASLVKPNLKEAYEAANMPSDASLESVAATILESTEVDHLLITRSEEGISIFNKEGYQTDFPTRVREVKDVTGAGDTVLATLSYGIANGLSVEEAAQLSNLAAGIAISHLGCARVTLSELAHRMLREDVTGKVFDEEHMYALQHSLEDGSYIVLSLSSQAGLTGQMFQTIRTLSQKKQDLLVLVKDEKPDFGFIQILSSLHEVDFILLKQDRLERLQELVEPLVCYDMDELGKVCEC